MQLYIYVYTDFSYEVRIKRAYVVHISLISSKWNDKYDNVNNYLKPQNDNVNNSNGWSMNKPLKVCPVWAGTMDDKTKPVYVSVLGIFFK